GEAVAEELEHLALALRQERRVAVRAGPDLTWEARGELRRELCVPARDAVDGARDLLLRGVLRQVARRAGLERAVYELVVGERREHEHASRDAVAGRSEEHTSEL